MHLRELSKLHLSMYARRRSTPMSRDSPALCTELHTTATQANTRSVPGDLIAVSRQQSPLDLDLLSRVKPCLIRDRSLDMHARKSVSCYGDF